MSTPVRTLTTVSSVVLLWLMSVSFADAAQTRHKTTEGQPCDAQSTTLKKLARHSKKLGGPRRFQPADTVVALTGMTARLQRATRADVDGDEAAIQNDAPAAPTGADERPVPTLRPLGLLIGSLDIPPLSRAFSPRSPRGPPPFA
jgi:hypothetical protein